MKLIRHGRVLVPVQLRSSQQSVIQLQIYILHLCFVGDFIVAYNYHIHITHIEAVNCILLMYMELSMLVVVGDTLVKCASTTAA